MSPRALAVIPLGDLPETARLALAAQGVKAPRRRRTDDPEHRLQAQLVADLREAYPEIVLYAVPNFAGHFGKKHQRMRAGARAKAEGRLAGVPDLVLAEPRYPFHGLYLEAKAKKGGRSEEQRAVQAQLERRGYLVANARTLERARAIVDRYLALPSWAEGPHAEARAIAAGAVLDRRTVPQQTEET